MARRSKQNTLPETPSLIRSVPRSNPASVLGVNEGNTILSTSDDVFPTGWVNNKNRIGLNELGVSGEASVHALHPS